MSCDEPVEKIDGAACATAARSEGAEPLFRLLPSLGDVLLQPALVKLAQQHSRELVTRALRSVLAEMRQRIGAGEHTTATLERRLERIAEAAAAELQRNLKPSLVRVLNATGVLLHTNMGRAPLSAHAIDWMANIARGYSNLELDLETGERGRREDHAGPLLLRFLAPRINRSFAELAETHDVAVVNNCAAATFLALNTLADGGEAIVSRGELVEIGGSFRVPEILAKSGARLREVGTTNRTRIGDYEAAIGANTRLILRVHQSNFKMEGFTERPSLADLVRLGASKHVAIMEDQGTGLLLPAEEFRFGAGTSFVESFRHSPDVIAASGDKLLGGPQCGLLVGERRIIDEIRRNPLFRAFRVDKLTYAALEATLIDYIAHREDDIPLVRMMRISQRTLRTRCRSIVDSIGGAPFESEVVPVESVVGGGTTPGTTLASFAIALRHRTLAASALQAALRRQTPPLIARIQDDWVLLDLRAIAPEDDAVVLRILREPNGELAL